MWLREITQKAGRAVKSRIFRRVGVAESTTKHAYHRAYYTRYVNLRSYYLTPWES